MQTCTRTQVRPGKKCEKPTVRAHHEDDVVINQELLPVAVLCVVVEKRQTKPRLTKQRVNQVERSAHRWWGRIPR
jgi:hypothetical protein